MENVMDLNLHLRTASQYCLWDQVLNCKMAADIYAKI